MKPSLLKNLKNIVEETINEATKVNFRGHRFVLKVDVNEDPNKKGIKVQFIPVTFGNISSSEQDEIAMDLGAKLEEGLEKYKLKVERDRNLKDKSIIGFFIYIEYLDRIIRNALASTENGEGS